MLTGIKINNFKKLDNIDIELGRNVVFIGPNNSGKTTALQALALWSIGLSLWIEKRHGKSSREERPGVTVNRDDLISIPVPYANLLWKNLHVREKSEIKEKGTENVRIDIIVDGVTNDNAWSCGLEFDYANEESFYCRPLRLNGVKSAGRMSIPDEVTGIHIAFLPPMSGLAANEPKLEGGRINVLIGEGQTAQVLRNLCWQIYDRSDKSDWEEMVGHIRKLFGVTLMAPRFIKQRGEITMAYMEDNTGAELDLSCAGRGLQQTLLLLANLYANPKTVLLLDEPDAHLEVLRQIQTYNLLTDLAGRKGSQIIAASHSEAVLNEAANRDIVIAFVGKPHRIDDRGSQLLKALREIGFDQYYLAEFKGWVLYLEGSTDLAILQSFAKALGHQKATAFLEQPFVCYVGNQPPQARHHFNGLKEACPSLVGIAIYDRIEGNHLKGGNLTELMWTKREIENYLCMEEVLISYARHDQPDDLFGKAEADRREETMRQCIEEIDSAYRKLRKPNPWSADIKASDDFLDLLFEKYFEALKLPNVMRKSDYHILTQWLTKDKVDPEITKILDSIVSVAEQAKPRKD